MLLEVCVDNIESVLAAAEGGAGRIELCAALSEGGLTPSVGMLLVAREKTKRYSNLQIFTMIRTRRGDFLYTTDEIRIMTEDIVQLKRHGADGFVFGCLNADGSLDMDANKQLIAAAAPLPCTLHRAFDVSCNPMHTAQAASTLGFERILTSGQQKNALLGIDCLKVLKEAYDGRLVIMPGVGINEKNVAKIVQKTGVTEIHSSASVKRHSNMLFKASACSMSLPMSNEFELVVTDSVIVRQNLEAASNVQRFFRE